MASAWSPGSRVTTGSAGGWTVGALSPPQAGEPSRSDPAAVVQWVAARVGLVARGVAVHGEVRHAFTHFRLRALVWEAEVAPAPSPAGHEWLAAADVAGAPLPRPVKTLLAGLGPAFSPVR